MTETYKHTKICTNCGEEFKTFIGEYIICVYCWYDKLFPKIITHKKKSHNYFLR